MQLLYFVAYLGLMVQKKYFWGDHEQLIYSVQIKRAFVNPIYATKYNSLHYFLSAAILKL